MTEPRASIKICITVTFMLHSFFFILTEYPDTYTSVSCLSFYSVFSRERKVQDLASPFFMLTVIMSGRLVKIRWSVCVSKSQRSVCVSCPRIDSGLCIYHLFIWSNFKFLHNSQWITSPTQSCLVFYSFSASLLHSLIMSLIVSSLSPHNLHLQCCCVSSILALISLVLMELSCAAIRRYSVSFLVFPFLSQVQVFCCEMLFIRRLKRP